MAELLNGEIFEDSLWILWRFLLAGTEILRTDSLRRLPKRNNGVNNGKILIIFSITVWFDLRQWMANYDGQFHLHDGNVCWSKSSGQHRWHVSFLSFFPNFYDYLHRSGNFSIFLGIFRGFLAIFWEFSAIFSNFWFYFGIFGDFLLFFGDFFAITLDLWFFGMILGLFEDFFWRFLVLFRDFPGVLRFICYFLR